MRYEIYEYDGTIGNLVDTMDDAGDAIAFAQSGNYAVMDSGDGSIIYTHRFQEEPVRPSGLDKMGG
jgi:hypothetical protein